MAKLIEITIRDKIAKNFREKEAEYICGNSDFAVAFDFDDEWNAFSAKTARFKFNGTYIDVPFTGKQCKIPIIENTHMIKVGVFAGNLHTTTSATIMAKKSILCGSGVPAAPSDDVYNQIMELISNFSGADPEVVAAAVKDYMENNPVDVDLTGYALEQWVKEGYQPKGDYLPSSELYNAINTALEQAKASGAFDGAAGRDGIDGKDGQPGKDGSPGKDGVDGKDGYTPVKGVDYFDGEPGKDGKDYVLTDADKTEIAELAAELVEVPEGGGGSGGVVDTVLVDITLTEETSSATQHKLNFDHDMLFLSIDIVPTTDESITSDYALSAHCMHSSGSISINMLDQWSNKTIPPYGATSNRQVEIVCIRVKSSGKKGNTWFKLRRYMSSNTEKIDTVFTTNDIHEPTGDGGYFYLNAPYGGKFGAGTKIKLIGRRFTA